MFINRDNARNNLVWPRKAPGILFNLGLKNTSPPPSIIISLVFCKMFVWLCDDNVAFLSAADSRKMINCKINCVCDTGPSIEHELRCRARKTRRREKLALAQNRSFRLKLIRAKSWSCIIISRQRKWWIHSAAVFAFVGCWLKRYKREMDPCLQKMFIFFWCRNGLSFLLILLCVERDGWDELEIKQSVDNKLHTSQLILEPTRDAHVSCYTSLDSFLI